MYLLSPVPVLLVQRDDGEKGLLRISLHSTNSDRLFPKKWEILFIVHLLHCEPSAD